MHDCSLLRAIMECLLQVLISRVKGSSPGIRRGFVATLEPLTAFDQVGYMHGKQFPQLQDRKNNSGNNTLMWVEL